MTRLDTISLTTSTDYIQDMQYGKFTHSNVTKSNGIIRNNYILESNMTGIKKVVVNEVNGTVGINISSKILGLNYPQGICLNTIDQVCETINKTGLVLLPEFINNSILNSVDIKSDLRLRYSPENYIQSLNNLIAPKFAKAKYPSGISFNENVQQNPIRFTAYDKAYEMQKNRKFYKLYPELLNSFVDMLRLESRLSQRGTIRKYLKSNTLIDALNFKNLNYNILTKIVDNQTNIIPVFNTMNMTNTQEKNFAQIYYLNHVYNGDFESILRHIKSKLGSNTKATYQRELIKNNLAMINNSKDINAMQNIAEIQKALIEN